MKLVGEITEQASDSVASLQNKQDTILKEIGRLEFQKSVYTEELKVIQQTIQRLLEQEVLSLGIPKGAEWQIAKDRKVYVSEVGDK